MAGGAAWLLDCVQIYVFIVVIVVIFDVVVGVVVVVVFIFVLVKIVCCCFTWQQNLKKNGFTSGIVFLLEQDI